jgi:hypothetical protein
MTTRPRHLAIAAAVLCLGFALMWARMQGLPLPAPRPSPELDAACFQMDAAIAKLEIDATELARTGQPTAAFNVQMLIAKAREQQRKDGCP